MVYNDYNNIYVFSDKKMDGHICQLISKLIAYILTRMIKIQCVFVLLKLPLKLCFRVSQY